eukprot:259359-Chlamydomonas_euryale.AAC.5
MQLFVINVANAVPSFIKHLRAPPPSQARQRAPRAAAYGRPRRLGKERRSMSRRGSAGQPVAS